MSKTAWWIVGIIVAILVVWGIWWAAGGSNASTQAGANENATTTVATSTDQTTAANDRSAETVAGVIAGLGTSQFESLLSGSGINLSGKGPYTVFVSTNAGYALLPPGTIANMSAADRKRMIEYSIVGKALNIDATQSGSIQTLSGDTLNFQVSKIGLVQANSSFALQEYKASNGIVYVVNQPLLPPVKTQ